VTLVGERRRVDAVLPADEPVGALLPDVLVLLGDPVRRPAQLRHLVTASGEVLAGNSTLAEGGVLDGSVLRLVRADEPLPAPVVHEVPEAVDGVVADHLWRWTPRAAEWTATVAVMAVALAVGLVVTNAFNGAGGLAVVAMSALAMAVTGLGVGAVGVRSLGTALLLGGGALAAVSVWFAGDLYDWPGWGLWGGLALLAGVLFAALGTGSSLGRGGLIGGGLTIVFTAVWGVCAALGLTGARAGAIIAMLCVIALSTMLRIALILSGLTSLDDRRTEGSLVSRADVHTALVGAHRSMVIGTGAVAVAAGGAGWALADEFDRWTAALAALLAIVVASRARLFPLVPQKAFLFAAALVSWAYLAYRWAERDAWALAPALGMLVIPLVVSLVVLTTPLPEHVRARLRGMANKFEAVAVVAMIPVAIGTFGVFERLLHTF
jgi:type VII secretion integral membrane protein EccD